MAKKAYIGVDGVARKVKKGYVGVPTLQGSLGSMTEGDVVQINENGSPVDFYVAKHNYESAKNGEGRTLLVRKYCYDERKWDSSTNDYSSSDIDTWLNGTYKKLLDSDIQSAMDATWFYYTQGNNTSVAMLKRSVFLLSVTELGKTASWAKKEGSALPIASTLQVAHYNGTKVYQWTRSRDIDNTDGACSLDTNGDVDSAACDYIDYGSRPCFTLPATLDVTNGLVTGSEASTKEVARLIKKAYIGVGGVARPCWSGGELTPYGTITELSAKKARMGATTLGKYAVFAGGEMNNTGVLYSTVEVYDDTLVRTTPSSSLSVKRYGAAAACADDKLAIFAAGLTGLSTTNRTNAVDAFDETFTYKSSTMDATKHGVAGTSVGEYAVFGQGSASSYNVRFVVFNSSLTRTIPASTGSVQRYRHAATTIGGYGLFAGGQSTNLTNVDSIDANLTVRTLSELTVGRDSLAGATVGDKYAVFAGGENYDQNAYYDAVDAYDSNLTKVSVAALSNGRTRLAGVSVGNYAVFAGGLTGTTSISGQVDLYDEQLTHTLSADLSANRYFLSGARVGNFAIFAGGRLSTSSNTYSATADVYTVD